MKYGLMLSPTWLRWLTMTTAKPKKPIATATRSRNGSRRVVGDGCVWLDTEEDQHEQEDRQHLDEKLGQRQVRRAEDDEEEGDRYADHAQRDDGAQSRAGAYRGNRRNDCQRKDRPFCQRWEFERVQNAARVAVGE